MSYMKQCNRFIYVKSLKGFGAKNGQYCVIGRTSSLVAYDQVDFCIDFWNLNQFHTSGILKYHVDIQLDEDVNCVSRVQWDMSTKEINYFVRILLHRTLLQVYSLGTFNWR